MKRSTYGALATNRRVRTLLEKLEKGDPAGLVESEVIQRAQAVADYARLIQGVNCSALCGVSDLIDTACFDCGFIYTSFSQKAGHEARIDVGFSLEEFKTPSNMDINGKDQKLYSETIVCFAEWLANQGWTGVQVSSALELWISAMGAKAMVAFEQEAQPETQEDKMSDAEFNILLSNLFGMEG